MIHFFDLYILAWTTACVIALYLMVRYRKEIALFQAHYWIYLFQGWKIISFLIAATGLVIIAPYTGDPTWDYIDAAFMSVLTFVTAPWSVGILYKVIHKMATRVQVYVATCLWLFSASWSYDIYLLFRDGYYPVTWQSNLVASSILYLSAGLFWNLTWKKGRGVIFGFMACDWLEKPEAAGFEKSFGLRCHS